MHALSVPDVGVSYGVQEEDVGELHLDFQITEIINVGESGSIHVGVK